MFLSPDPHLQIEGVISIDSLQVQSRENKRMHGKMYSA